jgi:hypothetical protein
MIREFPRAKNATRPTPDAFGGDLLASLGAIFVDLGSSSGAAARVSVLAAGADTRRTRFGLSLSACSGMGRASAAPAVARRNSGDRIDEIQVQLADIAGRV